MASVDVKMAFVVSMILSLTGVHGHLTAALLAEMQDVQGSACSENCETEIRYFRCIFQRIVEVFVLRELKWRIAKNVLWEVEVGSPR